jgi:hypothetical protein
VPSALLVLFDIPRLGTRARPDPGPPSLTEWRVSDGTWSFVRHNGGRHLAGQT